MSDVGNYLVTFSEAEAAVEPFRAGGIIDHAIGDGNTSVDDLVNRHLGNISMWDARGDQKPERPMYMLNPNNGLLMVYSRRKDDKPERSGLFAEVVTLDAQGKPVHGVDVVNPFDNGRVIPVAVKDNDNGFAPSHFEIRSEDSDDMVPPNLEIATLQNMLKAEPIDPDEPLADFLRRNETERNSIGYTSETTNRTRYRGTVQGLGGRTNPNLHLIISDRDATPLIDTSRELGIFPVHLTIVEMLEQRRRVNKMDPTNELNLLSGYIPGTNDLKTPPIPAFITYDHPFSETWNPVTRELICVPPIGEGRFPVGRAEIAHNTVKGFVKNNPVFAHLGNFGANDEMFEEGYSEEDMAVTLAEDRKVVKRQHGRYEQLIRPYEQGTVDAYEKWLRKVYLDFALTKYFRGLNEF